MTQSTTFKTTSSQLAFELDGAFVERGVRWPEQLEGLPEAWVSLAYKIQKSSYRFEATPEEVKELVAELENMVDIQQDHMDDFEGRALMRAMQAMLRKAKAAQ